MARPKLTTYKVTGDGYCGYHAIALGVAAHFIHQTLDDNAKFVHAFNAYYETTYNESALRSLFTDPLIVRSKVDLQLLLTPIVRRKAIEVSPRLASSRYFDGNLTDINATAQALGSSADVYHAHINYAESIADSQMTLHYSQSTSVTDARNHFDLQLDSSVAPGYYVASAKEAKEDSAIMALTAIDSTQPGRKLNIARLEHLARHQTSICKPAKPLSEYLRPAVRDLNMRVSNLLDKVMHIEGAAQKIEAVLQKIESLNIANATDSKGAYRQATAILDTAENAAMVQIAAEKQHMTFSS